MYRLLEEGRIPLSVPMGISIYRPPEEAVAIFRDIARNYDPPLKISVGDVVSRNLVRSGIRVDVAVVDGVVMRKGYGEGLAALPKHFSFSLNCVNPPGHIACEAIEKVRRSIKMAAQGKSVLLRVEGEEDLLAIPAVLYAPARSFIVYGHWRGSMNILITNRYLRSSVGSFLERYFVLERNNI